MDDTVHNSIIIPVFKNEVLLHILLNSLIPTIDANCEIIIIDDGFDDIKIDSAKLPHGIIYHSNTKNLGYAASVNIGVSLAKGKLITTINSDIIIYSEWLQKTRILFKSNDRLGVLGAKLLYPSDGTIQHAGVFFSGINYMFHAFRGNSKDIFGNKPMELNAVTFAFVSFLKSDFIQIGGLDENYYNSHEDIDFCLRIINIGKQVYIDPAIQAYHITSASEDQRFLKSDEAGVFFLNKWNKLYINDAENIFYLSKSYYEKNDGLWPEEAVVINLCRKQHPKAYIKFKELAEIKEVAYYSFSEVVKEVPKYYQKFDLNLIRVLPFSFLEMKWPIVYIIDSFQSLKENHYWQLNRKNKNDFIFDYSFNIISMKKLMSP